MPYFTNWSDSSKFTISEFLHNVPGIKPTVDYSAALQHLEVNNFLQEVQNKLHSKIFMLFEGRLCREYNDD